MKLMKKIDLLVKKYVHLVLKNSKIIKENNSLNRFLTATISINRIIIFNNSENKIHNKNNNNNKKKLLFQIKFKIKI